MRESEDELRGIVFDIQRFSIDDGPGIRTSVFLKGCPLSCVWCANPESQQAGIELAHFASMCTRCGSCVAICPVGAIRIDGRSVVIDRDRCNLCGLCVSRCSHHALSLIGRPMSVREVMAEIARDRPFYEESGGGLTLTGGEPAYQPDFSAALLRSAREQRIGTAIETCGFATWAALEKLLRYTDLVLYDLKILTAKSSVCGVGAEDQLIARNLDKLDALGLPIYLRFPIVPGYTDSPENVGAVADIAEKLESVVQLDLLPFHQYGRHKYAGLGRPYLLERVEPLQRQQLAWVAEVLAKRGLDVKIVG